jgi:signal recognition particle subunit SRP54
MIPGANKFKFNAAMIDEKQIARNKAIIQSMTPYERRNPDVIKGSQKKRIAAGSGTSIQEVNALLKNFYQSKELMKFGVPALHFYTLGQAASVRKICNEVF